MKASAVLIFTLAVATQAHATTTRDIPVKCTLPDGKVSYQTGSCPANAKIEVVGMTGAAPSGEAWRFDRTSDQMTGDTTCTARSPKFTIPAKREYASAQVIVVATRGEPVVTVASMSPSAIFHHKIGGTGMKVGDAGMIPFAARPSQTLLVLPGGTGQLLVDSMLRHSTAQVRVRYWPWDDPYDSHVIPLQGFKQAFALAKACVAAR